MTIIDLSFNEEQVDRLFKLKKLIDVGDCSGVWLAGGTLRRVYLNQSDNDIDLFFTSKEAFENYRQQFEAVNIMATKKTTDSNITYKLSDDLGGYKVQLIHIKYYPTLEELLNSFDFTLCMAAWDLSTGKVYTTPECLDAWNKKQIVINKISYAVSSVRRIIKYVNQGFYLCPLQIEALLDQVVNKPTIINRNIVSVD